MKTSCAALTRLDASAARAAALSRVPPRAYRTGGPDHGNHMENCSPRCLVSLVRASALPGAVAATLLLPAQVAAQDSAIRGHVVDDSDLRPVPEARVTVVLEERRLATGVTDSTGAFLLSLPGADTYRLEMERRGYRTTLSQPVWVGEPDTLTVEFRVLPDAVLMAPLTVTARSSRGRSQFQRRRETWGRGVFLDPAAVDSIDPSHPADVFRDVDEMWLSWDWGEAASGARGPYPVIRSYMGRGCMMYVIDGVPAWTPPARHPSAGVPAWLRYPLAQLRPEDLVAVEIYRSLAEAPPGLRQHGTPSDPDRIDTCGVTLFWTRHGW